MKAFGAGDRQRWPAKLDIMKQYIVHVVVDDEFGDKLHDLPFREPAWVVDSPTNKVIIKELWEARADENHTEGITSFIYDEADPPEKRFMGILDSMIEHHGPYSHDPPCSKVNVIGAELTDQIRNFLSEYDFTKFEITKLGFTAEMTGQQDA